jgi:hypothetical protein
VVGSSLIGEARNATCSGGAPGAYDRVVSVTVSLEQLRAEIELFATAPYLLTVSDDDRPHCVAVVVSWDADELVMGAGNHTLANATARTGVSLLWPPAEPGGYSLIVDATVTAANGTGQGDNSITVQPTRAVLHRPAAGDAEPTTACGADCVPVLRS